ncbi:hypothetical protein [Bradyrhizobium sp. DASA03007]|uniref:hypothetical protein n=1 Tax=unclassified Bradyrhizobium TaxID=2631580 RepID=UPI003F725748
MTETSPVGTRSFAGPNYVMPTTTKSTAGTLAGVRVPLMDLRLWGDNGEQPWARMAGPSGRKSTGKLWKVQLRERSPSEISRRLSPVYAINPDRMYQWFKVGSS